VNAERAPASGVGSRFRLVALAAILLVIGAAVLMRTYEIDLFSWLPSPAAPPVPSPVRQVVVPSTGSIAAALRDAEPGTEIVVEPGEYREQLTLRPGVHVVSRIPRAAHIRLPAAVPDTEVVPAVVAWELAAAQLVGFTISGDSATPLPVGILIENAAVSIVDVAIVGATRAAIDVSGGSGSSLIGSEIRDNPGAGLVVRGGAAARVTHSAFMRNGTSEHTRTPLIVEDGTNATFLRNVFVTSSPNTFATLSGAALEALRRDNWFIAATEPTGARPRTTRANGRAAGAAAPAPRR
jgi:hypothetical protein